MMLLQVLITNTRVAGVPLRSLFMGSLVRVFYAYVAPWDSDQLIPLERAVTVKTELFLSDKLMKNFGSINFITFGF